jgi:hypothetical protein
MMDGRKKFLLMKQIPSVKAPKKIIFFLIESGNLNNGA